MRPYESAIRKAINISITADQANLVWYKAHGMLQGPASYLIKDVKMTPFPTITFITGATFQARSTARNGHHLLGHDYDRVNWDEAAFEAKFAAIRDNVIRMRLVDRDGTLTYTSTGNGRNEFGRYVLDGFSGKEPSLYAQTGKTYENPNISLARAMKNAGRMSEKMRQQNIEGAIVDAGDWFEAEDLAAAVAPIDEDDIDINDMLVIHAVDNEDIVAWAGELFPDAARETPWRRRYPSHRYVSFWDLADKSDLDGRHDMGHLHAPARDAVVEFERFHKKGWKFVYSRIRDRHRRYPNHATGIDRTGIGDVVMDEIGDIVEEENAIIFTGPSKDLMLDNRAAAHQPSAGSMAAYRAVGRRARLLQA